MHLYYFENINKKNEKKNLISRFFVKKEVFSMKTLFL